MKLRDLVIGFTAGAIVSASTVMWAANKRNIDQEEKNLAIAMEFYDVLLNKKDFDAGNKMIGNRYVQHNPNATTGPEGLKAHIDMLKKSFPLNHGEIKHVFTNGDLVALHVHSKRKPESAGNAVVDMFRIENGKVVEHWDVVQAVPESGKALNNNTMF